jgi:imidazolonepropionase-like amidohydrolase
MRDALIRMLLPFAAQGLVLWAGPWNATSAQDLRIDHVTIVSAERTSPLRDAEVYIHDGRISAISQSGTSSHRKVVPNVMTINGAGLYLTPGLIDTHVHLSAIPGMTDEQERAHPDIARAARAQIPRSYLYFGFTTLIDLISAPEAMARWKAHDPVPDTYFCGGAALMDGYPMSYVPKPARYEQFPYFLIEPGSAAPPGIDPEAHRPATVVTRMKADGAICVKTFFERGFGGVHDLPVPRAETIRAVVRAAHAAGLPVLMHANAEEAQTFALDTGVDIIAHGLWNTKERPATAGEPTPAMKAILDRVIANKVGWQPTIQVLYGLQNLFNPEFLSDPMLARALPQSLIDWYLTPEGQWFHNEIVADLAKSDPSAPKAALRVNVSGGIGTVKTATGYLASHKARLLFGTDTPSAPTYANPPGLNAWMEMRNLVDAGVTPAQIFEMATQSNARALKLDQEIGTVQVGKRANLLLLRQDPTQTIQAYAAIAKVILAGRVLDPAELIADRKSARASHTDTAPMSPR